MIVNIWDGNVRYLFTIRSSFPDPDRVYRKTKRIRDVARERISDERSEALKQEARKLITALKE